MSVIIEKTSGIYELRQVSRRISDVDAILSSDETIVLCEVKASPLVAFPLMVPLSSPMIRTDEETGLRQRIVDHRRSDLPREKMGDVYLYIPYVDRRYNLGSPLEEGYPFDNFRTRYAEKPSALLDIIHAWGILYEGYARKWSLPGDDTIRWLTFGCGKKQHVNVDDSKNAPGIDRTDDIKKGVYQMLKLGERYVTRCQRRAIGVALLSNIHAIRHYDDYLAGLDDIVWAHERRLIATDDPTKRAVRVQDLIRLYDATITLTSSTIQDERLRNSFELETWFHRIRGNSNAGSNGSVDDRTKTSE